MRIGITDSGVGGLSVCAAVEERLRGETHAQDVEIIDPHAALRDDYSSNAMPSRQQTLETFDRFLANVAARYRPDMLYIACNSLSVLFQDPYFDHHRHIPIMGILETGTAAILSALAADDDAAVIVFATPTTVEEGTYRKNLIDAGIAPERIVQQACPGLPDAISNDFSGRQARVLLERVVPEALARFTTPPPWVKAFLGCTHYGYQAKQFDSLLRKSVHSVDVLNPNNDAATAILEGISKPAGDGSLNVHFVTPYEIPEKPLASLPHYLGGMAPSTIAALRQFVHDPGLYEGS